LTNKFFIASLLFILLLAVAGCDDAPTSIGSNLIPHKDKISVSLFNNLDSTIVEKSGSFIADTLRLNSSTKLLLGKNGNVNSVMMMKYIMFLPDSVKEAINDNSIIIKSASIEMFPDYRYGDENASFDFHVNKITSDWNSLEFTKYDLSSLQYDDVDLKTGLQNEGDSLITFDFDKDLTLAWMKLAADGIQEENYGVIFNYTSETDKILGFPGIGSVSDSVLSKLKIIIEVPNKFSDTLSIHVTSDIHVVNGELPQSANESLIVQGGIPVYSKMYFDLSLLPNYAIINKATLKLFVDNSETQMGTTSFSPLVLQLLDDYENNEIGTVTSPKVIGIDSTKTYYSGDITSFVQYWVTKENNGVMFTFYDETANVNKLAIYSPKISDAELRPYLEIIYTAKN